LIEKKNDKSANMKQKYGGQKNQDNMDRRFLKSLTMAETTIKAHLRKSKNFIRVSRFA